MEKYLYTCQYCGKDYKPNRRKVQKYCSNSCRTTAFILKKKNNSIQKTDNKGIDNKPQKVEKMSLAGVGNAAAGTFAVNFITGLLTSDENKPATKKDLNQLMAFIKQRYLPVTNLPLRYDGAKPNFDMQTNSIIYL